MDKQMIKDLFEYHYALFDQIWESAQSLTAAQFVAENDYSLGSLRNHMVHCWLVDDLWVARMRGVELLDWPEEGDFPDLASAKARWDDVRERVLAYVNALSSEAIAETVTVDLPHHYPEPKKSTRRQILLHMVNHGTDHRAQLLARLHELGADTFEQDAITYWWETNDA